MSEILGALFAVVVGLMYLPKVQNGVTTSRQVMADVATAQQQQQWVNAVTAFVQQNNAAYLSTATTTPTPITVASVKAANVGLPTAFSGTNPFNQTWAAAITQPSAGNLQVLVYATGGKQINDQELGSIARAAQGVGGMIPTNNSGVYPGGAANAYGAFGAWKISTASYSVAGGTPASLLNFNNGALTSNYLYRNAVPGQPQVNTMNTNMSMGGNTITNAQQIQLAAGNGVQIGSSYIYGDANNSAIRQDGTLYVQNKTGTAAAPLNAGNTSTANLTVNGGATVNGNVTIVGGSGGAGQLEVTGHLQADQAVDGNNYIKAGNIASAGAGCAPWGAYGSDGSQALFCQFGVWKPVGGTFSYSSYSVPINSSGLYLGIHAFCSLGQISGGPQGGFQQVYTDGANNWWATNTYWVDGKWADPVIVVNCLNLAGAGA